MTAGGVALLTADDLVVTNVICFDKADLNDQQLGQVNPPNDGRLPEAICAETWPQKKYSGFIHLLLGSWSHQMC